MTFEEFKECVSAAIKELCDTNKNMMDYSLFKELSSGEITETRMVRYYMNSSDFSIAKCVFPEILSSILEILAPSRVYVYVDARDGVLMYHFYHYELLDDAPVVPFAVAEKRIAIRTYAFGFRNFFECACQYYVGMHTILLIISRPSIRKKLLKYC